MSKEPNGPTDRDAAERLLRGTPGDPADPLAALLAAAAAPATPRELAREHEAMAAFRAARAVPVERPRHHAAPGRAFGKRFTFKVAAATIAVTGVGGVALAATGTLPTPLAPRPPAASTPVSPDADGGGSRSPSAKPRTPAAKPTTSARPGETPSSLVGLCRAYTNHPKRDERRNLLDTPAFRALVEAAGKPKDVPAYCSDVLGPEPEATQAPGKPEPRKSKGRGTGGLDLSIPL
jgi:hypothetical protein